MTDRIDQELEKFYAHISQQQMSSRLKEMTVTHFKERAARRHLFAAFGAGTLVVTAAAATAVVGLATHQGRINPGLAPHKAPITAGPATGPSSHATASVPSTTVTFTGAISGPMSVTSIQCFAAIPAPTPSLTGTPVPGPVPAAIDANGTVNGTYYQFVISQGAGGSLAHSKVHAYVFNASNGVTTFNAGHSTTFNVVLTPAEGSGAPVTAVGEIVCP